jgi:hypothetical protein
VHVRHYGWLSPAAKNPPPRSLSSRHRSLPHSSTRTLRAAPLPMLPGGACLSRFHRFRPQPASIPTRHGLMPTLPHFEIPIFPLSKAVGTSLPQNLPPTTKTYGFTAPPSFCGSSLPARGIAASAAIPRGPCFHVALLVLPLNQCGSPCLRPQKLSAKPERAPSSSGLAQLPVSFRALPERNFRVSYFSFHSAFLKSKSISCSIAHNLLGPAPPSLWMIFFLPFITTYVKTAG